MMQVLENVPQWSLTCVDGRQDVVQKQSALQAKWRTELQQGTSIEERAALSPMQCSPEPHAVQHAELSVPPSLHIQPHSNPNLVLTPTLI